MRITWVTRSFLDYRIPVYKALDELCGGNLTLIYSDEVNPPRVKEKIKHLLGDRAIALSGEIRFSGKKSDNATMANKGFRIPYQPGLIHRIKESNPNVMISDGFFQWTYAPLFVRATKRIPHIMCYERTPHTERNAGKMRTIYRKYVSRWIDAIDCNGILTAQYVRDDLGFGKYLEYGHMTAEIDGIKDKVSKVCIQEVETLRKNYNLGGLTFLYIGQIIHRKGIIQLLKAWTAAGLKDAKLLLVGDGTQKEEIIDFINLNHLTNVEFAGAVDYDALGPYYKAADCFIIPTLEDNWSLVVPEAMAAGLPVACSIYNGCHPELVKPENGWTFDPLDLNDTVNTLRRISESRDLLPSMGEESLKIVANHTPAHAARGIYEACLKVLNK